MTLNFVVGFAAAAILMLIIWAIKGLLLTPVRTGDSTDIEIDLHLRGAEPPAERADSTISMILYPKRLVKQISHFLPLSAPGP